MADNIALLKARLFILLCLFSTFLPNLLSQRSTRKALLSDKKFDQAVFYLMDNLNLLKQSLSADMDYSQLFEKLRKLNKKIKGISKPFHYMPKKTRTINQGRRAINAIISNIIGADCKKLQNLQDEQIFQM